MKDYETPEMVKSLEKGYYSVFFKVDSIEKEVGDFGKLGKFHVVCIYSRDGEKYLDECYLTESGYFTSVTSNYYRTNYQISERIRRFALNQ